LVGNRRHNTLAHLWNITPVSWHVKGHKDSFLEMTVAMETYTQVCTKILSRWLK